MIRRLNTALSMWTNKFCVLTNGEGVPQNKLKEEVGEFLTAQTKEDKLKEAADVTIVLATQLAVYGYTFSDFLKEIERKLDINLMRNWVLQADGTIRHV